MLTLLSCGHIRDIEIMKTKTIDQLKKVEQEHVSLSSEKLY